jgi:pimeloyl-ACP methyl ester carboxylesterase
MYQEQVGIGPMALPGDLSVPERASGLVVFAHGSGSSRLSPRNRFVAETLHRRSLATLLFDLLTDIEAADRSNVFNIGLLANRLLQAIDWSHKQTLLSGLPIGLFGASTGAAAALVTAAERPLDVSAVVSRGGRPDLALSELERVRAPTLLIVGAADLEVLALNRQAYARLACEKRLELVPRATHLFEEAGTLERAAELAREWFADHLAKASRRLKP